MIPTTGSASPVLGSIVKLPTPDKFPELVIVISPLWLPPVASAPIATPSGAVTLPALSTLTLPPS